MLSKNYGLNLLYYNLSYICVINGEWRYSKIITDIFIFIGINLKTVTLSKESAFHNQLSHK